jgi:hypothetical protein
VYLKSFGSSGVTVIKMYTSNNRPSRYMKHKLTDSEGETNSSTITLECCRCVAQWAECKALSSKPIPSKNKTKQNTNDAKMG